MENLLDKESRLVLKSIEIQDFSRIEVYGNWLAQTYYYVNHSVKLLALAIANMDMQEKAMAQRFIQHISEENNHELLALRDIKNLGFNLEDFPELPETRSLYEVQYYKVSYKEPSSLLGYILALEYLAVHIGPILLKKIEKHGTDKFLRLHAFEDIEHIKHALHQVNELGTLSKNIIEENIIQTLRTYSHIVDHLKIGLGKVKISA